jgi:endoglucanase
MATRDATRFLQHFVDNDGRVVRRDQGGDTVSEAQAYGMLIAVGVGDRTTFKRIWGWTKNNILRSDGLLSWHWENGSVDDDEPSADADLDAAHALALASQRFRDPALAAVARRMGSAIRATETINTPQGGVLAAGPWSTGQRLSNPSYTDPGAIRALSRLGDSSSWHRLLQASTRMVGSVAHDNALPPDWAAVGPDGSATPVKAPKGGQTPTFSFDAARVPIRFAASCTQLGREVAAALWPRLRREPAMLPRSLSGKPARGAKDTSVGLASAAAAAAAAGRAKEAADLLDRASAREEEHATYYGSALVALARLGIMTSAFGSCR